MMMRNLVGFRPETGRKSEARILHEKTLEAKLPGFWYVRYFDGVGSIHSANFPWLSEKPKSQLFNG
jgi:hypothetical protein